MMLFASNIGCGIYGFRQDGRRNYYKAFEEKVFELKSVKCLISYSYVLYREPGSI
jgi:hypothetical protein